MRKLQLALVFLALLVSGCARTTGDAPGPEAVGEVPAGSGWERFPDPPLSGRTGAVVQAVGDGVLVVGGWEFLCPPTADCAYPDLPLLSDGALLDPSTGQWTPVAEAPFGLRDGSSTAVGGAVYLLTGCRAGQSCDGAPELLRYDTGADEWLELGPVPDPASSYAHLVAVGERLLVLTDSDENGEQPDHLYDPATDAWRELPDDPLPRVFDRWAVPDGDRLLVFGSPIPDDPSQSSSTKAVAALDLDSFAWARLADAPGPGYQVWRSGEQAWVNPHFGSTGGGVLDLATDRWLPFPDPPTGLGDGDALDLAGIIGTHGATYENADGLVRDTERDRWLRIPPRPDPTAEGQGVVAVGDALVVFGGQRWGDSGGELVAETWIWRP